MRVPDYDDLAVALLGTGHLYSGFASEVSVYGTHPRGS